LVTLAYHDSRVRWPKDSIQANPPGSILDPTRTSMEEDRQNLGFRLQQSIWSPFPWDGLFELEGTAVHRTATNKQVSTDDYIFGDPRAQILLPIWQERYAGILVGGGVSIPTGKTSDWLTTHDHLGCIITGRWSGIVPCISWLTFGLSGEYRFNGAANQELYLQRPNQEDVSCSYDGYTFGGRLTYRLGKHVGLAVSAANTHDRWSQIDVQSMNRTIDESVSATTYAAHLTVSMDTTFLTLSILETAVNNGWSKDGLGIGLQLTSAVW
jgi:hypothetical protein